MIRDHLIAAIKQRFPDAPFSFGEPPEPVASLSSPCMALGQMQICDDGDEATIYFSNATHGHFNCADEKLTEEQKEQQIAGDVIEFVDAVLKDQAVIWQAAGGLAGGWRVLQPNEPTPKPSLVRKQFLWSREIS